MSKAKRVICRGVSEVVKLAGNREVLVEVRVTPLDDGGV